MSVLSEEGENQANTLFSKIGKHLKEKDRYQIEGLLKAKKKAREIAEIIGCSKRTIEREINRGQVTQLTSEY